MELFKYQKSSPVWVSFENETGARGAGGLENYGAKGHPFAYFKAGEEKVLCDVKGPGVVRRIWFTLNDRSAEMLQGVVLSAYWDGAQTPAFSVPIGDFFCMGNGHMLPMENAFFASPEGRSFICTIPMPFFQHGKLTLTNTTKKDNSHLFYDVDLTLETLAQDTLLFYATRTVTDHNVLGSNITAMPQVEGQGRFLGMHIALCPDAAYDGSWWGEGEVKLYLDAEETPSLVGTGMEDYLGTAWGQGAFLGHYQGCTQSLPEQISFYRFHVPDPIFFEKGCKVEFQAIGGCPIALAKKLEEQGAQMIPVAADDGGRMTHLYKKEWAYSDLPESAFITFYRRDYFAVTAYYYLANGQ